jgi:hypothetical protein
MEAELSKSESTAPVPIVHSVAPSQSPEDVRPSSEERMHVALRIVGQEMSPMKQLQTRGVPVLVLMFAIYLMCSTESMDIGSVLEGDSITPMSELSPTPRWRGREEDPGSSPGKIHSTVPLCMMCSIHSIGCEDCTRNFRSAREHHSHSYTSA